MGFISGDSDIFSLLVRREEASEGLPAMLWLLCPHSRWWWWQSHLFPIKHHQGHEVGCHVVWILILPPNVEERKPSLCCTCSHGRICGPKY